LSGRYRVDEVERRNARNPEPLMFSLIWRNTSRSSTTRRALKSVRGNVSGGTISTTARKPSSFCRRSAQSSRIAFTASAPRSMTASVASTRTSSSSIARSRVTTMRCSPP